MIKPVPQILLAVSALLLAFASPTTAQERAPGRGCGTTENNEAMQQELEQRVPGYQRNVRATYRGAAALPAPVQSYTLPIVFHVIHNGEAVGTGSNISDARILEQLNRLNEDFSKLNADRTSVPAVFQPAHADVQVKFALAQRDLAGNCFNGIDRINRHSMTSWTAPPYSQAYCNSTIKPQTSWDPTKYMNFWVVDLGGGLLGFAQFPDNTAGLSGVNTSGGLAATDGVVCLYSAVGNGGAAAAPYNLGRTATHEVGHWLGLRHIWGDAACGDDGVADTPTQAGKNYGCPSFPHVSSTCAGSSPNGDQFMNYMDYTDDACMFMFSAGQKERVQAVMGAGTPRRTSLATSPALPPAVTIDATTSTPVVCAGSAVFLNGIAPSGYTFRWTGPNGFTSTQQNPSLTNVTSAAAGTYTLTATPSVGCPVSDNVVIAVRPLSTTPTLVASNNGISCGTAPVLLTATPAGNQATTLLNQNWNTGTQETGWTLDNTGDTGQQAGAVWETVVPATGAGVDGTRYIAADATGTHKNALTRTSLYSPVFHATDVSTLNLAFQHIFTFAAGDVGKVEIRANSGPWTTLATYSATAGTVGAPASASIDLTTYAGQTNLQLRWNYSSNSGQSWAVDNMVVSGTTINTYAWSVVSGDGLPAILGNSNTLLVSPSQNSVYQVTVTAPGKCASVGARVSVTVPTATTWTGSAGDGDWDNPANWTPCAPTRTISASIPNGLATVYPTITTTAEVNNLTQHGPLTISGGSLSLYGHHTGAGTFAHTGGSFVVAGLGAQTLRGLAYRQLLLNGAGSKTLTADASASNAVTLSGGILLTGSNTLTLSGAALLSEAPDSYVLGRVFTTASLAAGSSSSFRGIGLDIAVPAASVSPGATTALRVTGVRLISPPAQEYQSISRYFDITPTVNANLNLRLTMQYNAAAELGAVKEARLLGFRSVNVAGPFERMPGALDADAGTYTISNVDHLSFWTLADANAPLPVSLSKFEVAAAGPDAQVAWTTASEKNNAYFVIETSTDGRSYRPAGRVEGRGNSAQRQQYSFRDAQIARYGACVLYYRLRQVDTDGKATLSGVKTLTLAKCPEATVAALAAHLFPNPSAAAGTGPQLWLAGTGAGPATLTLRDAVGRVLSTRQVSFNGTAVLGLPEAQQLRAGVYVLEVQQGAHHVTVKLLRD